MNRSATSFISADKRNRRAPLAVKLSSTEKLTEGLTSVERRATI
jgi:hypothetical protein